MMQRPRYPAQAARPTGHSLPQESELVVAILRTALIILAVLTPFLRQSAVMPRAEMQLSVLLAALYNLIVVILYWRRVRLPGQRHFMVLADILLVTSWVYLTWNVGPGEVGSPLFPFYFVIVIVAALWFGVSGALGAAAVSAAFFLLVIYQVSGSDAFALVDALYRQVVHIFLVAIVTGYLVDTHVRERERWTRSQVLLAQYQERFRAAQEVYELLIPAHTPQVAGLELAARWRPALQEGGGDFYDVIPLESGRVALTIADVSGKHTRGSLKLPLFKAAFLASAQVWRDPGKVLAQVNRIVYPHLQPDMFISACVIVIDPARHRMRYSNAGQDPPLFVRERTHAPVKLETGGLVLGVEERATYPSEELRLEPGDTVCLYTDGITEARSPEDEEFGYAHLEGRVQSGAAVGLPADSIADNIFEAVSQHMREEARHDDMTVVVMRYRPEEREGELSVPAPATASQARSAPPASRQA